MSNLNNITESLLNSWGLSENVNKNVRLSGTLQGRLECMCVDARLHTALHTASYDTLLSEIVHPLMDCESLRILVNV